MLKRFIKWCLAIEEIHSRTIVKKSLTGEPLLVWEHGGWSKPMCLRSTPLGTQGALIYNTIKMNFHSTKDTSMKVLKGEFDNCLDKETKESILKVIETVVCTNKGKYGSFSPDHRGILKVKTFSLSEDEMEEYKELMRLSSR